MCRFASFFYCPVTGEIKVKVLDSHGETEKQLNLNLKLWREGHYTPDGEVELRLTADDRVDSTEYKTAFMNRFPTFASFFNWAMDQEGIYVNDLDLSSLTKLPDNIVLPKEINGSFYLSSLTKLPDNIVLPKKINGSLDLSRLTKLPDNIVLPKEINGYLNLSGELKEGWNKRMKEGK